MVAGPMGENIHFINNSLWKDTIKFVSWNTAGKIVNNKVLAPITDIKRLSFEPVPRDRVIELTNIQFLTEDPFVNFKEDGTGDYRLKPGSALINAGVGTGAPVNDIDGWPRPKNKIDIGPYESPEHLTNAGFEEYDKKGLPVGWSVKQANKGSAAVKQDSVVKHSGKSALKITAADEINLSTDIAVTPNTAYSFSTYLKGTKSFKAVFVKIVQKDANGKVCSEGSSQLVNKAGNWTQLKHTFKTDAKCKTVSLSLVYRGTGDIWFDDSSLILVKDNKVETPIPTGKPSWDKSISAAPVSAKSGNLLHNPGFEINNSTPGRIEGWLFTGGNTSGVTGNSATMGVFSLDDKVAFEGKRSIKIVNSKDTDYSTLVPYPSDQWIPVQPNTKYEASGQFKSEGMGTGGNYYLFVVQRHADGKVAKDDTISEIVTANTDQWRELKIQFTTTSDCAYVEVRGVLKKAGTLWLDDFRLIQAE